MSFAADGGRRAEWFFPRGESRSKLSRGMDSLGEEEAPGEESGEGEALVAPEWLRQWRRLRLPEVGKKTSPGRLAAMGELGEHSEAACVLGGARGASFYSAPKSIRGGRG